MSKPKTNNVYNFFKRSPNSVTYVCQIDKCNTVISAHTYSLERHIRLAHYAVYKRDFLNHKNNLFNFKKKTDDGFICSPFLLTKNPKKDTNANGLTAYEEKLLLLRTQRTEIEQHVKNCYWCILDKSQSNRMICKEYSMLKRI